MWRCAKLCWPAVEAKARDDPQFLTTLAPEPAFAQARTQLGSPAPRNERSQLCTFCGVAPARAVVTSRRRKTYMGYPLQLAVRYMGSKKRASISVGTAFAMLGVTLGVAAL